VVVKVPRWPFDKFKGADRTLTTSMKSTGEVMAIGRTLEEAFIKAKRSIDTDVRIHTSPSEIRMILSRPTDERFHCLFDAFRQDFSLEEIAHLTSIVPFFLEKIKNIVDLEKRLAAGATDADIRLAKTYGYTNAEIAAISGKEVTAIEELAGIPVYKMVDTCAAEFPAVTPYFYSTHDATSEIVKDDRKKILILGSGPIRIGQGIEFDYCTVHAVKALREEGVEVHIVNNNPETVSTDFDTSDRLFFEPMQLEDVTNILRTDSYYGVMVQFGGQNAVNLAVPLEKEMKRLGLPTRILGTTPGCDGYRRGPRPVQRNAHETRHPEPREQLRILGGRSKREGREDRLPGPCPPLYVLGGRAMEIVHDTAELETT
jgi:carbamoyl-phosphate synthase large subunit